MTDEEFEAFLAEALSELETKQDALTHRWGFGAFSRYLLDQPTASLQFMDASGAVRVRSSVIPIGSYAARSGTWKWAWANESLVAPLRAAAGRLRELQGVTGLPVFGSPAITAQPDMAWEMAAMSVKHLGALGCYRAPGKDSDVYLAIMEVPHAV
jgi:hypothetical protein